MASPNTLRERELKKELWKGVAKFYPTKNQLYNPKRDARRRLPEKVSGRQWRKIRQLLRREIPETKNTIR
jgi:hypothetical protein